MDGTLPDSPDRESLVEIAHAAKRAAELCSQMLAYAGKGGMARTDFSLNELIESLLPMMKAGISKDCALTLNLGQNIPSLNGDPGQIRQAITSLVINASESLEDRGGAVSISTGVMECTLGYLSGDCAMAAGAPGPYVYMDVADTGCGIPPSVLPRIFEPFFTTKFTGRGLGLSAVLGIVRAHKGAIGVRSQPKQGTTFRVLLPVGAGTKRPTHAGNVQWRGHGTVLLVDDESDVMAATRKLLERLGCRVLVARDGQEAVEVYRQRQADIDVVLLDLTMPRMNGEEAFERMRAINHRARIVIASGYSESDVVARFAGKDLSGCLQKPYTIANLAHILSGLLPSAKSADPAEAPPATEGR
jgi:CheY-like chemotaxis protein